MRLITLHVKGDLNEALAALLAHRITEAKNTTTYPKALSGTATGTFALAPLTRVLVDGSVYGPKVEAWFAETPNSPPDGGHPRGTLLHYHWHEPEPPPARLDTTAPAVF